MMLFRKYTPVIIILCSFVIGPVLTSGQENSRFNTDPQPNDSIEEDYFDEGFLRYEDHVYLPSVKTVLLHQKGFELSQPIVELGSDDKLVLSFDELDGDVRSLKYDFIHCNADWQPSETNVFDVVNGFSEDYISDYSFSFNTTQKYVHYELVFPTQDMKPRISGNYLLRVYFDDDKENVLITRRFMVFDPKLSVKANVHRATQLNDRNYKQEIDFEINMAGFSVSDPFSDLKPVILQNNRWDNAIRGLNPLLVKGDVLDYNYDRENVFSGGNEFRRFDIKSLRYYSERIRKIVYDTSGYNVYLLPDERRAFKVYASDIDINGRRLIKTEDGRNSAIQSDYCWVHFFFPYVAPRVDGAFYVSGALTDYRFIPEAKMIYNFNRKGYYLKLYLKQGYYNYQYVFLENGKEAGDASVIEGSRFETENDYMILVYYRAPGNLYDELIGMSAFNSHSEN